MRKKKTLFFIVTLAVMISFVSLGFNVFKNDLFEFFSKRIYTNKSSKVMYKLIILKIKNIISKKKANLSFLFIYYYPFKNKYDIIPNLTLFRK